MEQAYKRGAGIQMWSNCTLGLESMSTQACRGGSVDQLYSGIAFHSTNMQTNTEPFQIIHAHQFCNQLIPEVVCIIVHNTYLLATWLTTGANTFALFP